MKRSEMMKVMLESYCKEVPYNNDGGIQLQWKLVRLLEDMEEAGILPPVVMPPDFIHEELTMVNFVADDLCIWEPEDE